MRTLSNRSIVKGSLRRVLGLTLGVLLAFAAVAAAAEESGSYGYLRVVDGPATLIQGGSGTREEAEINQPLLAGDRLLVPSGSRLEAVLSDGNLLRIDGGSDVGLLSLAGSPDGDDPSTRIDLAEGTVQLVVFDDALGAELPRIDTPNATFYVQHPGTYRLSSDQEGWSSFLVREGGGEVITERGAVTVRADEEAEIEGERFPRTSVRAASGRDSLERWADRLDQEAERYASNNDLGDLSYQGSSLGRYGSWLTVGHRRVWRPTVDGGWHPYWHGRWASTPAGLTWVSYEPWGWVPYHYGSWDYAPGYGWVWEPGYVWSPAWVYWYWGPRYVSWCPVGYYTRYYGDHGWGFRGGVYGWAGGGGGGWDGFGDWTFIDRDHFGRRDQYAYSRKGRDLRDKLRDLDRGIVTTDTRGITPDHWKDPEGALRVLRARGPKNTELPDVTAFVAREPKLPADVLRTIQTDRPADGTPLKPSTLGPKGLGQVRPDRAAWGTAGGSKSGRPTIQLGGGSGGSRDGGRTADEPRIALPDRGVQSDTPKGRSGKTWDRGDTGDSGPRVRLPERDSGSSGDRDRGEPAGKTWNPPPSGNSGGSSSGGSSGDAAPQVREPESRPEPKGRERVDPPKSWSRSVPESPRVRSAEPEPRSTAGERPQVAPEPRYRPSSPPTASARPDVRVRQEPNRGQSPASPAPRVRSEPSAPPAQPAPQARSAEPRSKGDSQGGQPKGNSGNGRVRPPRDRDR
jgi:hypothetical protein